MIAIKQIKNLLSVLANKINLSSLSTDVNLGTNDTLIPSQNAVKTYVDDKFSVLTNGLIYKGQFDASINTDFSSLGTVKKGYFYFISNSGTVDSLELSKGDMIIINNDTSNPTHLDIDKIDNTQLDLHYEKHVYTHSGAFISSNTTFNITLLNNTANGFLMANCEGVFIKSNYINHVIGTNIISLTLPFTVEDGEIIEIYYMY